MSDIPSAGIYIQEEGLQTRSPEASSTNQTMGGSINYCIDRVNAFAFTFQSFTSNGSFVIPANVTRVLLIGCGGGGGGAGSSGTTFGTGGLGALFGIQEVGVTPGSNYSVVIGAAGSGGSGSGGIGNDGIDGGDTQFIDPFSTVLVTFKGGSRGLGSISAIASYLTVGLQQSVPVFMYSSGYSKDSPNYSVGPFDATNADAGLPGGGGQFGGGGAGGTSAGGGSNPTSPLSGSGAGGGGGYIKLGVGVNGAAGASGQLLIGWIA